VRTAHSDAVVPRTKDGWQPLSAAYHSRCRIAIEQALHKAKRSIIGVLDIVQVEAITEDEMLNAGLTEEELVNINTPDDWRRIVILPEGGSESS